MHVSFSIFCAATIFAAFTFGAQANTQTDGASTISRDRITVYYGDLNIDTEHDAKIMLERIEQAAKKACGGHATFGSYIGSLNRTFDACRSETIERTVQQLGASVVKRIYSEAKAT
jgi:UrcA family protein